MYRSGASSRARQAAGWTEVALEIPPTKSSPHDFKLRLAAFRALHGYVLARADLCPAAVALDCDGWLSFVARNPVFCHIVRVTPDRNSARVPLQVFASLRHAASFWLPNTGNQISLAA